MSLDSILNPETAGKIGRIIGRMAAFQSRQSPGHFLIRTHFPMDLPSVPDLRTVDMERDKERYLAALLSRCRCRWEAKEGLDDDEAPTVTPAYGIAEHSAWMGQTVAAQETTNHPEPLLDSIEEADKVDLSGNTPWFRYMKESYEILRSMQDGDFLLTSRGAMSPMELANALRGNDILMEFVTHPDAVHGFLQMLTEAGRWYYRQMIGWADEVEGGHFFAHGYGWARNCFGHLGNDTAMMCSPDIYSEFGLPYERKLTEDYDSVIYHSHSAGLHFLNQVAQLGKLALLEISEDPNCPQPINNLDDVYRAAPGVTHLMIHGTSEQFRDNIAKLKERNVLCDVSCRDKDDARNIIDFIGEHSE